MAKVINKIFDGLLGSFDNERHKGFSARKLTAFAFMLLIVYIHMVHVTPENAMEALIIDVCGILICLGIVSAQNIIEFKNGSTPNQNQGNNP